MKKDIEKLILICREKIKDNESSHVDIDNFEYQDGYINGNTSAYEDIIHELELINGKGLDL